MGGQICPYTNSCPKIKKENLRKNENKELNKNKEMKMKNKNKNKELKKK